MNLWSENEEDSSPSANDGSSGNQFLSPSVSSETDPSENQLEEGEPMGFSEEESSEVKSSKRDYPLKKRRPSSSEESVTLTPQNQSYVFPGRSRNFPDGQKPKSHVRHRVVNQFSNPPKESKAFGSGSKLPPVEDLTKALRNQQADPQLLHYHGQRQEKDFEVFIPSEEGNSLRKTTGDSPKSLDTPRTLLSTFPHLKLSEFNPLQEETESYDRAVRRIRKPLPTERGEDPRLIHRGFSTSGISTSECSGSSKRSLDFQAKLAAQSRNSTSTKTQQAPSSDKDGRTKKTESIPEEKSVSQRTKQHGRHRRQKEPEVPASENFESESVSVRLSPFYPSALRNPAGMNDNPLQKKSGGKTVTLSSNLPSSMSSRSTGRGSKDLKEDSSSYAQVKTHFFSNKKK